MKKNDIACERKRRQRILVRGKEHNAKRRRLVVRQQTLLEIGRLVFKVFTVQLLWICTITGIIHCTMMLISWV